MYLFYRFLIYVHVSSVILSIGPFFVLIPMVKKLLSSEFEVQQAYISIFRFTVRLTKHAGHVLVGSGVLLVALSGWTWKTPWIVATILVMVSSLFFLARAFSPILGKLSDPHLENKEFYVKKLARTIWMYIGLLMLMLWFMVAKPMFW